MFLEASISIIIMENMDYLDLKKEARHRILLFTGYACIAVAIGLTSTVLLHQAYGFGVQKDGNVTQNGLAFFSSQPNPANVIIDGKPTRYSTNTRVSLASGIYNVELSRAGYNSWERTIEIKGGGVHHFDHPFLIPTTLTTREVKAYSPAPGLTIQSSDRRWLMVQQPNSMLGFEVFDLKSPEKPPTTLTLPSTLVTKTTGPQSWKYISWASDNENVLLEHIYDGKSEFVLVNRTAPEESRNLNSLLGVQPSKLTFIDKKFDKYYLYNQTSRTLQTASISAPTPVTVLENVIAYKSYGTDTILYATDKDLPTGTVAVRLKSGDKTYNIRTFAAGSNYLLDLTKYSGDLYVVAGSSSLGKVYIYKDPIGQTNTIDQAQSPTKKSNPPVSVLRVNAANYISFSNSAQFIMAQNGNQYGVYDFENERVYNYTTSQPMDSPAVNATWMDGSRLSYVSGGKTFIFDYDYTNPQFLSAASGNYLPAFSPDYKSVYTLSPAAVVAQINLLETSLRTAPDR